MAHIDDLKTHLNSHDPERFLVDFLTLIMGKASLTLPKSIERETAKTQWQDCIPSSCGTPTEAFLTDLANLWAEIVQENRGEGGEALPKQLLHCLIKRTNSPTQKLETPPEHSIQRVTPSISSDYTKLEAAKKKPLRAKNACIQACKTALLLDHETDFLIAYLELNVITQNQILPKTSISGKAYTFFDQLIKEKFKQKMPEPFLEKLTGLWINIVAKKGLPSSAFHVAELFYHTKAHHENDKPKTKEKPSKLKQFLRRFF